MSSGSVPQVPGISEEERLLLAKQGIAIDQFSALLAANTANTQEAQDLMKSISGLYKEEVIPEKTEQLYGTVVDTAKVQRYIDQMNAFHDDKVNINGSWFWRKDLESALSGNVHAAQQMGLTTVGRLPDRVIPEHTQMVLDQEKVAALKERVALEQKQRQAVSDLAYDRYTRALEGTLPASEGLLTRKAEDWSLLREAAARRGIRIEGDSPETATSQTTAGNELVAQFKKTYGLLEDAERQAVITGQSPSANPTYASTLNLGTSNQTAGLLPAYSSAVNLYGSAMQPYYNQRMGQYQGQLAGYTANNYMNAAYLQAGAQLGAAGLLAFA